MTFFYDLNKRLNDLVAPKQTLSESACGTMDEAGYSAKAARAGKDIGKPGKQFAKIAKSAAERYGSEERGEKVAGAVLAKLRAKESVEEAEMDESALQAYLGKKKYGADGMKALQRAGRDGASKEKMGKIRAQYDKMDEAEMDEGNEFSGALARARATGAAKFKVDGKTYTVKEESAEDDVAAARQSKAKLDKPAYQRKQAGGDWKASLKDVEQAADLPRREFAARKAAAGMDEQLDEREFDSKDQFDRQAKPGDTYRGHKGTHIKTKTGVRHERRADDREDEQDDEQSDAPKAKGRPKGTGKKIGARGPSGRSKLHAKDAIRETDMEEDYDRDEYDEEGEMAKSQSRTIADAAMELQDMLGDNENLPEWVQKKINLAKEYIDTARDYLKANRPEDSDEEMIPERAVSRSQQQAAGIALAAKRAGKKPAGRGAAAAMAKMPAKELEKFAKTKHKGLPEKKPAKKEQSVEETTVAGSVAPSVAEPAKKGKKGMTFGKGIYDSFNREVETLIAESMNVSVNVNSEGSKSVTVSATDEDAERLGELLQMAGLGGMGPVGSSEHSCPTCNQTPCGCAEQVDENKPDWPTDEETSDDALQYSGGLNKPKVDVAGDGQSTVPVTAVRTAEEDDLARLREMAGIVAEAKPDFLDLDKDGDLKESMKKAAADKKHKDDHRVKESIFDMQRLWQAYKG